MEILDDIGGLKRVGGRDSVFTRLLKEMRGVRQAKGKEAEGVGGSTVAQGVSRELGRGGQGTGTAEERSWGSARKLEEAEGPDRTQGTLRVVVGGQRSRMKNLRGAAKVLGCRRACRGRQWSAEGLEASFGVRDDAGGRRGARQGAKAVLEPSIGVGEGSRGPVGGCHGGGRVWEVRGRREVSGKGHATLQEEGGAAK